MVISARPHGTAILWDSANRRVNGL